MDGWVKWDWEKYFSKENLEYANQIIQEFSVQINSSSDSYLISIDGFVVRRRSEFPKTYKEISEAGKPSRYLSCQCGQDLGMCAHVAAYLIAWERKMGIIANSYSDPKKEQYSKQYNPYNKVENLTQNLRKMELIYNNSHKFKSRNKLLYIFPRLDFGSEYLTFGLDIELFHKTNMRIHIKDLPGFVNAMENGSYFQLSYKHSVNLGLYYINEEGVFWFDVLKQLLGLYQIQDQISRHKTHMKDEVIIDKEKLDLFYQLCKGQTFIVEGKSLRFEDIHPTLFFTLTPGLGNDELLGAKLKGNFPYIVEGKYYKYFYTEDFFSLLNSRDEELILTLTNNQINISEIEYTIDKNHFTEFYYRTLPLLREIPLIELEDYCNESFLDCFPKPGRYIFYLDRNKIKNLFLCRIQVIYDDNKTIWLSQDTENLFEADRDWEGEMAIIQKVQRFFPKVIKRQEGDDWVTITTTKSQIYQIYGKAVSVLEGLGEIQVSKQFGTTRVRQVPKFNFSLSLMGDLLKLELINSEGLSAKELKEVYESYREKKEYHELQDGTLLYIQNSESINEFEELSKELNISIDDLLNCETKLPSYRVPYLYWLIEEMGVSITSNQEIDKIWNSISSIKETSYSIPMMENISLLPYQVYGYQWLRTIGECGFGGILADDMGLGKTVQTLALLAAWKQEGVQGMSLIVCPASLVYNWRDEAKRFTPFLNVQVVDGNYEQRNLILEGIGEVATDIYIVSYNLLRMDIDLYKYSRFLCVILDEATYIKNSNSVTFKAVKSLSADHRFALTGTPIENRLSELWSIFDFVMPGFLYSSQEFQEIYDDPISWDADEDATRKLTKQISPFLLRRKKIDVLKEIPEKIEETKVAEPGIEQEKLYDAQVVRIRELIGKTSSREHFQILAELTKLRQLCCDPSLVLENYQGGSAKRELCIDLVRSALEAEHSVLIFSQFTSMLNCLAKDLEEAEIEYYILSGETSKISRINLVNHFNKGEKSVFLISLKAGGTGLNLVGADTVIHYDPWWNMSVQNQATDRAYRMGQTRVVTVYKLIMAGTIEEKIVKLQNTKKELADAILNVDEKSLLALSKEELLELLS